MKDKKYIIRGIRPLLMSNCQASDPLSAFFRQMKDIRSERNKTEEQYKQLDELCFLSQIYFDDGEEERKGLGAYIPSHNIFQMLIEAGRKFRKGQQAKSGIHIDAHPGIAVQYEGPKTLEGLQNDPHFRTRTMVPNKRDNSRSPVVYPKFSKWQLEIPVSWDETQLSENDIDAFMWHAGDVLALGAWRPVFGRFEVIGVERKSVERKKKKTKKGQEEPVAA
jgi:hypothetical protein